MNNEFILLIVGLIAIALMTQKWFWILVLGLCTLASGFTVLASIINFQIIVAVGFTVLTVILAYVTGEVIES